MMNEKTTYGSLISARYIGLLVSLILISFSFSCFQFHRDILDFTFWFLISLSLLNSTVISASIVPVVGK